MKKRWLVTIVSLLVLAASFGLPAPGHTAGLYTHTVFVERAMEILAELDQADTQRDYSELLSILQNNMGSVNYGALFPDLGYGIIITPGDEYDAWAEKVHDSGGTCYRPWLNPGRQRRRPVPPFRAALIAEIQDHIQANPRSGEDEKMIAFLFGLIAHQEADVPWHYNGGGFQGVEAKLAPLNWTEPALDTVLYHYDPWNGAEFALLTDHLKADIAAASAAAGKPAPEPWGCVSWPLVYCVWDPYWLGQNGLMTSWGLGTTDFGPVDSINEFLWDWNWGGIHSGAHLIALAWKETWDLLTGRPEVSSVTISGPTEGGPGSYYFTAAFEPADAIPPLGWVWDNGAPFEWTDRWLTAGTHTLTVTATGTLEVTPTGCKETTLATAVHTIVINKADAACNVTGWTGAYDGNAHGASGTCTGVGGVDLSAGLSLGDSFTDVPGGTAHWSFTDVTGNYNNQNGAVEIVINKADPTCSIEGYSGVYDGDPHGASGSCAGVKAETLNGLDLGSSFTDVPGGAADWTFTDVTGNYNEDSGSVAIDIGKATLTVTADNQSAQYSDASPALTFQYAGFVGSEGPEVLDTPPTCSTTRLTSSPASPPTYPISCSGGADNNYTFSYANGTFTVTKEDATVIFDSGNPAALRVSTPGGPLNAEALTLNVYVKETLPDLPTVKALAGDISNASLSVDLVPLAGGGAISLSCTPSVAGTGYDGVNTFSCTNSGALPVGTYDVIATVTGNYYTGVGYDGFTVYDPSLGFATGGGWFYWPGTTEKTNFGFTMKYNPGGTNPHGSLLVLRHHADGTVSRLKSNALDGLALQTINGCGIATFSGKATYMTWDSVAGEYVNTGGNAFSVYAEDCNEPGIGVDSFWVRSVGNLVLPLTAPGNMVAISSGNMAIPHTME